MTNLPSVPPRVCPASTAAALAVVVSPVAHGHTALNAVLGFDRARRKYVGHFLSHVSVFDDALYCREHLAGELACVIHRAGARVPVEQVTHTVEEVFGDGFTPSREQVTLKL